MSLCNTEECNTATERQRKQLDADERNARKDWMAPEIQYKHEAAKLF